MLVCANMYPVGTRAEAVAAGALQTVLKRRRFRHVDGQNGRVDAARHVSDVAVNTFVHGSCHVLPLLCEPSQFAIS